jgi:phenylalanyl-tRNA synthetase beta chain
MQASLNGLRRYVELKESPQDVAVALTALGFEIEGLKVMGEGVTGVVVGEVRACAKHPEADKLSVCQVFDGTQELQVVCGAPNVAAGQKVLFAQVGAKLPSAEAGKGDFVIKKAKLRGVESFGMICAEDEVGLGEGHHGILILPPETPVGLSLQEIPGLCDALFEVNVTPNRPDALCHLGLARELAARYNRPLKAPGEGRRVATEAGEPAEKAVSLRVEDSQACPRYVGRVIEGVTVGESPTWLKQALKGLGKSSINNVVDATNYVLFELGQPSHAFDLDTLAGSQVVVRLARDGESLTTLDGVARKLTPQDVVIADGEKPQVLAGVMGGVSSGVSATTRRIFLEVAYFNPATVRLQARRHGLSSDSSYRFERGIDPLGTAAAADLLAALIAEVAGGTVRPGRLECVAEGFALKAREVSLRPDRARKLLGVATSDSEIRRLLTSIGLIDISAEPGLAGANHREATSGSASERASLERTSSEQAIRFAIPGFRGDLTREADLIEEVARLLDYNSIQGILPRFTMGAGGVPPREALAKLVRHTLRDLGLNEALNLRFTSRKQLQKLGFAVEDARLNPILLRNPLSEDWEAMPTTVLPNLLQALLNNQNSQQHDVALFEVAKTFRARPKTGPRDNGVDEDAVLCLAIMGAFPAASWQDEKPIDFYTLKGLIENLLRRVNREVWLEAATGEAQNHSGEAHLHPREAMAVRAGRGADSRIIGHFGMLHPKVQQNFDLKRPVAVAELSLDALLDLPRNVMRFTPFSTQVAAQRDFNALVTEEIRHADVLALLPKSPLMESLRLRSIYRGQGVPEGHKAMHYEVAYRHAERSLTDEEVQAAHEAVKAALARDERIRFK